MEDTLVWSVCDERDDLRPDSKFFSSGHRPGCGGAGGGATDGGAGFLDRLGAAGACRGFGLARSLAARIDPAGIDLDPGVNEQWTRSR